MDEYVIKHYLSCKVFTKKLSDIDLLYAQQGSLILSHIYVLATNAKCMHSFIPVFCLRQHLSEIAPSLVAKSSDRFTSWLLTPSDCYRMKWVYQCSFALTGSTGRADRSL